MVVNLPPPPPPPKKKNKAGANDVISMSCASVSVISTKLSSVMVCYRCCLEGFHPRKKSFNQPPNVIIKEVEIE